MKGNRLRAGLPPSNAFVEGHTPWNAGKKGIHLSPATEFIKGRESNRKVPVGTLVVFTDKSGKQRAKIKITDPNHWQLRAVRVWEANFGPVPKGCVIHHDDRNSLNDTIDNLICMSRRAHINEHMDSLRRKQRQA